MGSTPTRGTGVDMSDRVERLTKHYEKWRQYRSELGDKYDFSYKRPQNYKNCLVIRWKKKLSSPVTSADFTEEAEVKHTIYAKYGVDESDLDWFMDSEFKLAKVGIYVYRSNFPIWAIPNDNKELQDFVLTLLPKWVKLTYKN